MKATIDLSSPAFGLTQQEIVVGCLVALRARLAFREAELEQPQRAKRFDERAWTRALAQDLVNFHQALIDLDDGDLSSIDFGGVPRCLVEPVDGDNELLFRILEAFEIAVSTYPIDELRPAHLSELRDAFLLLTESLSTSRPDPISWPVALDPRTLAARHQDDTSHAGTFTDTEIELDARDAVEARASRLDIPMADGRAGYFLMGADLRLEEREQPHVRVTHESNIDLPPGWKPAHSTFTRGIGVGTRAATALSRTLRTEEPGQGEGVVLTLRGMLPPYEAMGSSVALPVALEILRRKLSLPPLDCAATGAIVENKDGFFIEPLDPAIVLAKLRAVREDGFRRKMFAVTENGALSCDGLVTLSGHRVSLDAVARKLWGQAYSNHIERVASMKVRELGASLGWKDEPLPGSTDLFVRTPQAENYFRRFLDATKPVGWIIGGPTRTGKTWLVWDIMHRLAESKKWDFRVLHVNNSLRANQSLIDNLEKLVAIVTGLLIPSMQRVIVLDGLEYSDELQSLDAAIKSVAERSGIHVVVVRQSDLQSRWPPTLCNDLPSIYGMAALNDFVTALADQHRSLLSRTGVTEAELRDPLVGGSASSGRDVPLRDLWWITEQACGTASLTALREKLIDGVTPAQLRILTKIAYASLYGFGLPKDDGLSLPPELLRRFSIYIDHNSFEMRMAHDFVAYATTNSLLDGRPWLVLSVGAEQIAPIVRSYIKEGNYERVTDIFRKLTKRWIPTLRALIRESPVAGKYIDALIEPDLLIKLTDPAFCNTPWDAANLAITTSDHLAPKWSADILKNLLGGLTHRLNSPGATIRGQELRLCLRAIEQQLGLFWEIDRHEGGASEDETLTARVPALIEKWRQFEHLLSKGGGLRRILEKEKQPDERLRLAEAIIPFGSEELCREIQSLYEYFFDDIDRLQDRKYGYAVSVLDLIERLDLIDVNGEVGPREKGGYEPSDRVIGAQAKAREVADSVTANSSFRGLHEYCDWARLALRLDLFRDYKDPCEELYEPFAALIQVAPLREISEALNPFYDEKSAILSRLLDRNRNALSRDLLTPERGTLGEVADFLFGIQRWHRSVALSIVRGSKGAGLPDEVLGEHLAGWAREQLDARNAGLIIKAMARLDDDFTEDPSSGFAYRFVQSLGLDFILGRIRSEPRTAIVFYLMEGLASIEHPFLQQVLDEVVERIADAINQRNMHPWSAQLAVMLCEAPTMGDMFKEAITAPGRVDTDAILQVMKDAPNLEVLNVFHRLAALFSDLPSEYARGVPPDEAGTALIQRMRIDGRPDLMLLAANSIRETYRRAGIHDAAVLTQNLPYSNINNALKAAPAESVHVALDYLRIMLPSLARTYIGLDRARQLLDDKFNRLIQNPEGSAGLLLSLERIAKGSGLNLLKARPRRLEALEHKIQFLQNPRSYARAINLLVCIGYRPSDRLLVPYTHIISSQIWMFRSPALLVELLLMLRKFDEQRRSDLFQSAVAEISESGLKRRLTMQLEVDLVFFPALITLIAEGNRNDLAQDLASSLARIDNLPRRLPPASWFGMLRAVRAVSPGAVELLVPKFDEVLMERAFKSVQLDDVMFWRSVGAYLLFRRDEVGFCWGGFASCPDSLLIPKDPATQIFATAWLEETGWVQAFQDRAVQQILDFPGSVPPEMRQLVTLMAASPYRPEAMRALSWQVPPTDSLDEFGRFRESDAEAIRALLVS